MGLFNFKKAAKKVKKEVKKAVTGPHEDAIVFTAVIKVLGSPKEHVKKTLQGFVDLIIKNKDYFLINHNISKVEKVKVKEKESLKEPKDVDLFSGHVEVEIGTKQKERLFDFCFNFMPVSVEVTKPMNLSFAANEISRFLTDIQGRVHQIDWDFKMERSANILLDKKNKELSEKWQKMTKSMVQMLQNNVLLALKEKEKDIKELIKNIGIPEDQLKPFLDKMIENKDIKLEDNKYKLAK